MKISQEILKAATELEIRARRNLAALLAGNYRSAFRGSGMQFKEFRHYEPGDDIRHMSWTVTARTNRATVKVYDEERELDVVVLIDVSGSGTFGPNQKRKVDLYAELLAVTGLAAVRAGDKVGLLLFSDKVEAYLPPKRTRDQVRIALAKLLSQPLQGRRSDLRVPLQHLEGVLRNRSLVLIFSDFLLPPFRQELKVLSRRHEVILFHCYDDAERGSGLRGIYEVWDPETGESYLLDMNNKRTRQTLALYQSRLRDELVQLAREARGDYLSLSVQDDTLHRIIRFFWSRGPARL